MAEGVSTLKRLPTTDKAVLFSFGVIGVALLAKIALNPLNEYSVGYLVDPDSVADIASTFPVDEDEFILAAWSYVHDNVKYSEYNSDIFFLNSKLGCNRCYQPLTVLSKEWGNCVAMSSVLTSLLRARISYDRVYMAVGQLSKDGVGGHAWVEYQRGDGVWYLLESTIAPNGWQPRITTPYYTTFALFNDVQFICYSNEVCEIAIGGCDCLKEKSNIF